MTTSRLSFYADLALLLVLAVLWGASYTFIRIGVATIPPFTLIAARTLIAGSLLLALLSLRGLCLPRDRVVWGRFFVQAMLNSVLPFTLIAWAERSVDASLAAILNSTTPLFAFLFTAAVTRHEAVTARKLAGVVIGFAGISLVVGLDALSGFGDRMVPQLAIVAATACYGAAAVFGRNFAGLDPMVPAAGSMTAGAVLLLPVALAVDRPWTLSPSAGSLGALLALAVLSTACAFVIYFHLMRRLGSVAATSQAYLRVPIGVGLGVVLLGERLPATAVAGLVCVVAAVLAMTLPARWPAMGERGAG